MVRTHHGAPHRAAGFTVDSFVPGKRETFQDLEAAQATLELSEIRDQRYSIFVTSITTKGGGCCVCVCVCVFKERASQRFDVRSRNMRVHSREIRLSMLVRSGLGYLPSSYKRLSIIPHDPFDESSLLCAQEYYCRKWLNRAQSS
jgi:hypothetical protein